MTADHPTPHPADFDRLLRAARKGDERAWSTLYRWLSPQVLGYLRSARMRDPEDVLGNVFLEVARRIGDFKGNMGSFRSWVFTIARARRVDDIRRRSSRPEDRLDTEEHQRLPSLVDVESEALETLVLQDLRVYLEMLTDDQSEVIVLRSIVGLTSSETAEVTGRTVGAVEQLQHRATRKLRRILREA